MSNISNSDIKEGSYYFVLRPCHPDAPIKPYAITAVKPGEPLTTVAWDRSNEHQRSQWAVTHVDNDNSYIKSVSLPGNWIGVNNPEVDDEPFILSTVKQPIEIYFHPCITGSGERMLRILHKEESPIKIAEIPNEDGTFDMKIWDKAPEILEGMHVNLESVDLLAA
ncbi:hypothetical protein FRC12_014323 [Ceratobasidium sp. 428]|nr:hypothetical protein FRC12_014323 [Ceratobasidium sp. 428]